MMSWPAWTDHRPRRRPADHDLAADELIEGYVAWREACDQVRSAYLCWHTLHQADRSLAYAGYVAALDREELAAVIYAQRIERVERLAAEALPG